MIFKEFLVALVATLFICTLFALLTRNKTRRTGFGWFLLFVLLATWAGGIWLQPFGPSWGNIRWLQFLASSLVVVLLFTLFAPLKPPQGRHETLDQLQEIAHQKKLERTTYITLGILFWVVLVLLLAAIIIRYILNIN
jgi:hypothetical protein